jgi:hypothetical protein
MKVVEKGNSKSIFIESQEIKYVRIDTEANLVIIFQDPKKYEDKTIIGYRSKLIGDPGGLASEAELKVHYVYEEEIKDEEKIVQEGKLSEQDTHFRENAGT